MADHSEWGRRKMLLVTWVEMGKLEAIFNNVFSKGKKEITPVAEEITIIEKEKYIPGQHPPVIKGYLNTFTVSYSGEKTPGEMGPIKRYTPDYCALRNRSWQSYLDSEITQNVIKKFVLWVIGSGLNVQSEPDIEVLESEGIELNNDKFSRLIEARFRVFSKSKHSSHSGMENLHALAKKAKLNAIVGGDVLIISRVNNGFVSFELKDGEHIQTPIGTSHISVAKSNGNEIKHGVEISASGEHVAYYVRMSFGKFERIPAKIGISDFTTAWMWYGFEYRLDGVRGLPLTCAVLETLKKLDRYKEATVGSAEERAKIVLFVEHNDISTGENPLIKGIAQSLNVGAVADETLTTANTDDAIATRIAATTNKAAFNLNPGATLKSLDSKNDLYFESFIGVNIMHVCAAIGIPYEVAMSKYDSNFSASRAALKDWEHTINVNRNDATENFYQICYNNWLLIEILRGKVDAPGYLASLAENNIMAYEAYRKCRFTGSQVPHIDPVKEAMAERIKLGDYKIPLTTAEASTEALSAGEYKKNVAKFIEEQKMALEVIHNPKNKTNQNKEEDEQSE